MASHFKIIVPFSTILSSISPLAFAISFNVLKFLKCAPEIFVITPTSGLTIFDKLSISPFLSIPISKIP